MTTTAEYCLLVAGVLVAVTAALIGIVILAALVVDLLARRDRRRAARRLEQRGKVSRWSERRRLRRLASRVDLADPSDGGRPS